MDAEELLALGQPAFLPLVGQARLKRPEQVLPKVLAEIRRVTSETERGQLLTALASLMNSEETLEMIEKMLEPTEELLLDTPYLRRVREQGKESGLIEGKEAGLLEGLREAIMEAIMVRFDPAASEYRRVSQQIAGLTDRDKLHAILTAAIQAEDMAGFTARLADELSP